jgi:hypothetical protein
LLLGVRWYCTKYYLKGKGLRVNYSADMKVSEQCGIAAAKGNQILGLRRATKMIQKPQEY